MSLKTGILTIYPRRFKKSTPTRPKHNKVQNKLSQKAKARMFNVIRRWVEIVKISPRSWCEKEKIEVQPIFIFMTVTLASEQIHSDSEIKRKLLNPFLSELSRLCLKKKDSGSQSSGDLTINYLWRAEKQKNGNIHFHLIIDRFIPVQTVNAIWNRIQDRLGYVMRSSAMFPNGVDIELIYDANDLKSYLAKYLDKDSKRRKKGFFKTRSKIHQKILAKRLNQDFKSVENQLHLSQFGIEKEFIPECKRIKFRLVKHYVEGKQWGCSRNLLVANAIQDESLGYLEQLTLIDRANELSLKVLERPCGMRKMFIIIWDNIASLRDLLMYKLNLYDEYVAKLVEIRDEYFKPVWSQYQYIT